MQSTANLATLANKTNGIPEAKTYFAYAGEENFKVPKVARNRNARFTTDEWMENAESLKAQYRAKKTQAESNPSTSAFRILEFRDEKKIFAWKKHAGASTAAFSRNGIQSFTAIS